jgi:hypothetical protein
LRQARRERHQDQDAGDRRILAQSPDLRAEGVAVDIDREIDRFMRDRNPAEGAFDRRPVRVCRRIFSNQDRRQGWGGPTFGNKPLNREVDLGAKSAGESSAAQELSCQGTSPDWPESRQNGRSRTKV